MWTTNGTITMNTTMNHGFFQVFPNISCDSNYSNIICNGNFSNIICNGNFSNIICNGNFSNISFNGNFSNISCTSSNNSIGETQTADERLARHYKHLNDRFAVAMAACQVILCFLITVGNSFTIVTISRTPCLKTIQNQYILSLAISDQLVGTSLLNLIIKNYVLTSNFLISCRYDIASLYTAICVSLMNMLSIAIDRYIYIVHPFVHMRHVTWRRTSAIICAQWAFAVLSSFPPVYELLEPSEKACDSFYAVGQQVGILAYAHTAHYFLVCSGIGMMYGLIARVAKQHSERRTKRVQATTAIVKKLDKTQQMVNETEIALPRLTPSADPTESVQNDDVHSQNKHSSIAEKRYSQTKCDVANSEKSFQCTTDTGKSWEPKIEHGRINQSVIPNGNTSAENSTEKIPHKPSNSSEKHIRHTSQSIAQKSQLNMTVQKGRLGTKTLDDLTNQTNQKDENLTASTSNVGLSLASLRWMKQMVIVFGLFVLCWTPSMTCTVLSLFRQLDYKTVYVLSMFGVSNSAVNFFIYALYNKQFRVAIKEKCFLRCRCRCCKSSA